MMLPRVVEFGLTLTLTAAVMTSKNRNGGNGSPAKKKLSKTTSYQQLNNKTKDSPSVKVSKEW